MALLDILPAIFRFFNVILGLVQWVLRWLVILSVAVFGLVVIGFALALIFRMIRDAPRHKSLVVRVSGVLGLLTIATFAFRPIFGALLRMMRSVVNVIHALVSRIDHAIDKAWALLIGWLNPVFDAIAFLLTYVLITAMILVIGTWVAGGVLLVVGLPGILIIDQVTVARSCGQNPGAALKGSFSLGVTIALLLFVGSSNPDMMTLFDETYRSAWFLSDGANVASFSSSVWPQAVETLMLDYAATNQAPLFDAVLLVMVTTLSCLSMARLAVANATSDEPTPRLGFPQLLLLGVGALLAVVVTVLYLAFQAFKNVGFDVE